MKNLKWMIPVIILSAIVNSAIHVYLREQSALRAFKILNSMIIRSSEEVDQKNERQLKRIEAERKFNPEKIDTLFITINQIRTKTKESDSFIDSLLEKTYESKGREMSCYPLDIEGVEGGLLKTKLTEYKKLINELMAKYLLPSAMPLDLTPPLGEDRKPATSWQMAFFHNIPKIGAITILTKFQNDVKNTEAMCIDRLAKEVVSTEVFLDRFEPIVTPKSSNVPLGGKYEAIIELGASSSTVPPQVSVNGKQIEFKDGKALYTISTTKVGTVSVPVIITIPKRNGGYWESMGSIQYTVHR